MREASGFSEAATALADAYADLTTHAETMLEHNVSLAALRVYKLWAIDTYFTLGQRITTACTQLTGTTALPWSWPPARSSRSCSRSPAPRRRCGSSTTANRRSHGCSRRSGRSVLVDDRLERNA
jgi:hypothetical protein